MSTVCRTSVAPPSLPQPARWQIARYPGSRKSVLRNSAPWSFDQEWRTPRRTGFAAERWVHGTPARPRPTSPLETQRKDPFPRPTRLANSSSWLPRASTMNARPLLSPLPTARSLPASKHMSSDPRNDRSGSQAWRRPGQGESARPAQEARHRPRRPWCTVWVCPPCGAERGYTACDLFEGVTIVCGGRSPSEAGIPSVMGAMMLDQTPNSAALDQTPNSAGAAGKLGSRFQTPIRGAQRFSQARCCSCTEGL